MSYKTIGITGGLGSGKSLVSSMFAEKGALLVDADQISHDILNNNEKLRSEIIDIFGEEILTDGVIDRRKLAEEVFFDKSMMDILSGFMHPIIIGKIKGGANHGKIASEAALGFEIRSDSYKMVKKIFRHIKDIVEGISHENEVDLNLKTISNLRAARLKYNHPLVKNSAAVLETLGIKPFSKSTESAMSIFLSQKIPAVTLGITVGENVYQDRATMQIEPMYKGIAQVIGVLQAIDSGVCDEQ